MQTLCNSGFKISNPDKLALEHYLLKLPNEWATDALLGMINKAVKTIFKDWYDKYAEQAQGEITLSYPVLIPEIINTPGFVPYNIQTPETPIVTRKQTVDQEIWTGGFNVEDYEKQALDAYYENPEAMLRYFMENKIYQRRKAMCKEKRAQFIQTQEILTIPAHQDDFIDVIVARPDYKNRVEQEAEIT